MSTSRIAITGMGAISPLGPDLATTWASYRRGDSGIRSIDESWVRGLPSRVAGIVHTDISEQLTPLLHRRLDRCTQLGLLAAREAWHAAGFAAAAPDARVAVVMGCGIGGLGTMGVQYQCLREKGAGRINPLTVPMLIPNAGAAHISIDLGAHGGAHTPVSACASSAEALYWGQMLLQDDRADVVIAGGAEAPVNELGLVGFAAMRALSTNNEVPERASRPYGRDRDGFVIAEGAGMLVLEREDDARARSWAVQAFLLGIGSTADAHHIVTPEPEGIQAAAAIRESLRRSGLTPADLAFVQAHATGTVLGDLAEARALNLALGTGGSGLAVTAPKGQFGHMLGGAGAVETAMAILGLQEGIVPVSVNADPVDPQIDLAVVRGSPGTITAAAGSRFAIKNAFGFGGHNICLALQG